MKRIPFLLLLALTAGWLIACGSSSRAPQTQTQTSTFAFMQELASQSYIFTPMIGKFATTGGSTTFSSTPVIDPTTNQPVTAELYSIVLSPDGKKAVIDLYGGLNGDSGQWDIWVANSDGSGNPTPITNDAYDDRMPQFSADGSKVVFASEQPIPGDTGGNTQWQIVVMNTDGTGPEQVLPIPSGMLYQMAPNFSSDGSKIVMQAIGYLPGDVPFGGIIISNADGTDPVALTNPLYSDACYECEDEFPSFTADGSKIVFSRDNWTNSTEVEDIYIMNADGTDATKLSDSVGLNSDPMTINIAGVGERILFNSNRDNLGVTTGSGFELYSINPDGTGLSRLTNNTLFDGLCGWWYEGIGGSAAVRHVNMPTRNYHPQYQGRTPVHGLRW